MLAKERSLRPERAADAWDDLDEIAIRVLGPRWRRESRLTASADPARAIARPARTATTASLARMSRFPRRPRRASVIGLACVLALALLEAASPPPCAIERGHPTDNRAPTVYRCGAVVD